MRPILLVQRPALFQNQARASPDPTILETAKQCVALPSSSRFLLPHAGSPRHLPEILLLSGPQDREQLHPGLTRGLLRYKTARYFVQAAARAFEGHAFYNNRADGASSHG